MNIPRHIAIVMDGNGRWAKRRLLPRAAGHRAGVQAVRETVNSCIALGVEYLTLFAFSSENWQRPKEEVAFLMRLLLLLLDREVEHLHQHGVCLKLIGRRDRINRELVARIASAERKTSANQKLILTIAVDYGGRWDITHALQTMLSASSHRQNQSFDERDLAPFLALSYAPEPDLLIRTSGEQRLSNFLLWQLAYTELFFTDTLWPDFNGKELMRAIEAYQRRKRRFGRVDEQLVC